MSVVSQQIRYTAATVCVVLLTILVDAVWLNKTEDLNQQHNKTPEIKAPETNALINEESAPKKMANDAVKRMTFANITLPPPLAKKSVDEGKFSENTNTVSTTSEFQTEPHQVALHVKQLASLPSNARSLTFPVANTPRILNYMHACVGIDIGAINNNKLMVFSHKNSHHSDIVRVASGYTTAQEGALLNIYAPGKTLVRLYPVSFDQTLGRLIGNVLGSVPLSEFKGEYRMGKNSLWLTNISINQKHIDEDWQLHQGC
jgi:hypothetical protein